LKIFENYIETFENSIETVEKIGLFFTPPAHLIEIFFSHKKAQKTHRKISQRLPILTPDYVEELRRGRQIFLPRGRQGAKKD
jgi:hypothetical protein